MEITGENLGKKYGKNWIFRNRDIQVKAGEIIAITGRNGSGKSTLLKILSGYLTPGEGTVYHDGKKPDADHFIPFGFCAPYVELPEELTLDEFLIFHSKFRKMKFTNKEIGEMASLPLRKRISEFSTGMKQRVQLASVFYFENLAVFMDEPTSNLDEQGFHWWKTTLKHLESQTILIASNQKNEISECKRAISL